ncbi:hypothetical protein [Larkinella soli]|uniref:hypothetical protein n=1 Tax=Larkinella soli TaxID=1770527 RepID=UPI000FFC8F43|nr:hypothetical protein [Larkinella soli]
MAQKISGLLLFFGLGISGAWALPTVSILQYKKSGETDFTSAARRAIDYLRKQGGGVLTYPAGRFLQGPVEITASGITIRGAGLDRTVIVRNTQRGYAFLANRKRNVTVRDLTIDCDRSPIEGGIYFGGCTNCWGDRVSVRNADAASFVVSGLLFNGGEGPSSANGFRNCRASGQKRYHDAGGKSPFIAGDYARNTRFESCTVTDCAADAFDSDNAPGTIFADCVARQTRGISPFAGFWSEGEQTDSDHQVTWLNCRAVGFTNGFGISERVKADIRNGTAENCVHAVRGINHRYRVRVAGFMAKGCGKGLENAETDGVLSFTGPVTLTNAKTSATLARNAFCNYAGGFYTEEETVIGAGCEFDRDVLVSYENTGSRRVTLEGATLRGGNLRYYNGHQTELLVKNTRFYNSSIIGARIKNSRITAGSQFVTTDTSRTAIQLSMDTFNTTVDNSTFEGYNQVSNHARIGSGVRHNYRRQPR